MLFEVKNISKSFKKIPVIENFSLKVEQGDMIALVGKRRKGKTTLMQMLAGIIPVDEGEIYYNGKLVGSKGRTAGLCRLRKRKIGYLTTEAILMPDMTVYENLEIAQLNTRGRHKAKRAHAKEVLRNLGLKGKGRFFPNELSTLDKQKVCVARAIINEPEILICDEPTDILEGYGAEQLMDILEILNSAGYTIIVSTHSKRIASRFRKVYPVHEGLDLSGLNVVTEDESIDSENEDDSSYEEQLGSDSEASEMNAEEWAYLSGVEKTEENNEGLSGGSKEINGSNNEPKEKSVKEKSAGADDKAIAEETVESQNATESEEIKSENGIDETGDSMKGITASNTNEPESEAVSEDDEAVNEENEELPQIDFSDIFN